MQTIIDGFLLGLGFSIAWVIVFTIIDQIEHYIMITRWRR